MEGTPLREAEDSVSMVPPLAVEPERRREPPAPAKRTKGKPTVVVVAEPDAEGVDLDAAESSPSEWGSLLGDLAPRPARSTDDPVEWRVHDRTHLEFAIDYAFDTKESQSYRWEAYFFVPDSFRLEQTTYDKKQIYDDLLSYVRLAIPAVAPEEIAEACGPGACDVDAVGRLRTQLKSAERAAEGSVARLTIRRLRVFACVVRAAGLAAQRAMLEALSFHEDDSTPPAGVVGPVARFVRVCDRIAAGYRLLLKDACAWSLPTDVEVAMRWVDEDLSLFMETLHATASVDLQRKSDTSTSLSELAAKLAAAAVAEARYRRDRGYPSVGTEHATARDAEHIEFRRHVLKRFTSSVLWLKYSVRDGSAWVIHGLYAIAAAVAMTFAVFATLRAAEMQGYFTASVLLLVVSYAIKDRLKAILQQKLTRWADRRFPDRHWTIVDTERTTEVGVVEERAGFREFSKLPSEVLAARRVTREHALEEHARPETVLWHQKDVEVERRREGQLPSPMMTEIFRLNLGPWLAHTDDPKRTITFADPERAVVCSAVARRVYNLNVVYRLRREGEPARWKRVRVVVSRRGIERIDPIVTTQGPVDGAPA
jgi:hypothetical protein